MVPTCLEIRQTRLWSVSKRARPQHALWACLHFPASRTHSFGLSVATVGVLLIVHNLFVAVVPTDLVGSRGSIWPSQSLPQLPQHLNLFSVSLATHSHLVGGRVWHFLPGWKAITSGKWVSQFVQWGYAVPFYETPLPIPPSSERLTEYCL